MAFVPVPWLPDGSRPVPIVRCGRQARLEVLPLTTLYGSCWGHWSGRTRWCEGEECCTCETDPGRQCARRWLGWLPCRLYLTARRVILALTPAVAADLRNFRLAGWELRGRVLTQERLDARENAPLRTVLSEQQFPQGRLPEPFDVTWHVLHALGVSARRMEQLHSRGYSMMARDFADLDRGLC